MKHFAVRRSILKVLPVSDSRDVTKRYPAEAMEPLAIDRTTNVSIIDKYREWVQVQIIDPDYLSYGIGWTLADNIDTSVDLNHQKRIFTKEDIPCEFLNTEFEDIILHVANNITKYDVRCIRPTIHSTALLSNKNRSEKRILFMSCETINLPINVYFKSDDFR